MRQSLKNSSEEVLKRKRKFEGDKPGSASETEESKNAPRTSENKCTLFSLKMFSAKSQDIFYENVLQLILF